MKFFNMLGTVTRYVLAAVSCISLAQFLLLLNVGTENAGRLTGQSLARGVISGLVAAVLFYRAKKSDQPRPANVQTQAQVASLPSSKAQPVVPPLVSVPAMASTSVPTTDHSSDSFFGEHRAFISLIAGVVLVIVVGVLAQGGVFQLPWTLSAGTSQPRFIHIQGTPSSRMYDNRTGQACVSSPVVYDSFRSIRDDFRKVYIQSIDPHSTNPLEKGIAEDPERWASWAADSLDETDPNKRLNGPEYREFYKRYDALKANPQHPAIYHYDGMPYCKEL
jgi:hypothetical protein